MPEPVIIATARTPFGRYGGALSGVQAVALLRHVQVEVLRRAGVEPGMVDQLIGGCVTQIGEQSLNITRNAWLNSTMDWAVPAVTIDSACASSLQANHQAAALIAAGHADCVIACGVESMSRVEIGSNLTAGPGHYKLPEYPYDDPPRAQFGAAERIAERDGLTRADLDAYGARSQQRAAEAWSSGAYDTEVAPLPELDRDEGLRATTVEVLGGLRPTMEGARHTAGTTSQRSDGAAAVLWMSADRATELGLRARARLAAQVTTGCDPYYLLDGPLTATEALLKRTGMSLSVIDRYEINEAFAAIPLAWQRRFGADPDRLNVRGGAIAIGHPLGATGARLIGSALSQLEADDGEYALITLCAGGSLGVASLLQRL